MPGPPNANLPGEPGVDIMDNRFSPYGNTLYALSLTNLIMIVAAAVALACGLLFTVVNRHPSAVDTKSITGIKSHVSACELTPAPKENRKLSNDFDYGI